jgi:ABC-type transporter Mla subunit MlaD
VAYLKEEVKAGITVVAALLILSAFTILTGGSRLFEDYDRYYVKVMNAAGLEAGAQVKIGGVRGGRVLDIRAPGGPGEKITITVGIEKGHDIYRGTKAVISQVGFVGDIYLLLTVDGTVDEKIPPGSEIPSAESVDFGILMAKVEAITESVHTLVKDVNSIFSERNIRNIEEAVKNMNAAAAGMRELISRTKGDLSEVLDRVSVDLDRAEEAITAIKDAASEIGRTAGAAERTADAVTDASRQIKGAVGAQSRNIANLIGTINRTAETLEEVLQEIRNRPWSIIYKEEGK